MQVTIIEKTFNPIGVVAQASAVCYNTKIRDREHEKQIIRARIKDGHDSVLEHASFTFLITGVSRCESHQEVRHRISSISQQSQRYAHVENFDYIIPPEIKRNEQAKSEFEDSMKQAWETYENLIKMGIKKEDARYVLPEACTTSIVHTFNVRSLRNFLNLRLDKHAQWEIRAVARAMADEVIRCGCGVFIEDIMEKWVYDVHVDAGLTNLSVKYQNDELIGNDLSDV